MGHVLERQIGRDCCCSAKRDSTADTADQVGSAFAGRLWHGAHVQLLNCAKEINRNLFNSYKQTAITSMGALWGL